MNSHVITTSSLPKRIWLARTAVALLAIPVLAFASHAQAAPAAGQGNHTSSKIILQHHHHAQAPGSGNSNHKSKKIILQHHPHK